MIVEKTEDIHVIKSVLCHPEIYDRISGDDAPDSKAWSPPLEGEIYLAGYTSSIVGIVNLHPVNKICWEVHIQVLPDMRRFAHAFGDACLNWIKENTPALKLVAQIPTIYPDVIAFAESKGFRLEGLNRNSYMKHDKLIDQVYMGYTYG